MSQVSLKVINEYILGETVMLKTLASTGMIGQMADFQLLCVENLFSEVKSNKRCINMPSVVNSYLSISMDFSGVSLVYKMRMKFLDACSFSSCFALVLILH